MEQEHTCNPQPPCLDAPQDPKLYVTGDSIASYARRQEDVTGDGQTQHSGGADILAICSPREWAQGSSPA